MTDRPIIFSALMIRALLDGRKTQTRRILKPQPSRLSHPVRPETRGGRAWVFMNRIDFPEYAYAGDDFKAPCAVGDRLWVRENWSHSHDGVWSISDARLCGPGGALYAADGHEHVKWFPSIYMPREFSRLTLIVESVKVERLQEISEDDAEAEGCQYLDDGPGAGFWIVDGAPMQVCAEGVVECFERLWESINGPDSWAANPWVSAISFRVVKANIDALCEEVAP